MHVHLVQFNGLEYCQDIFIKTKTITFVLEGSRDQDLVLEDYITVILGGGRKGRRMGKRGGTVTVGPSVYRAFPLRMRFGPVDGHNLTLSL